MVSQAIVYAVAAYLFGSVPFGKLIAKKKAVGISQREESFDIAVGVLDKLRELKGKSLKEQETMLSSINFDKKTMDDLVFIHSALKEKPVKLGVEALKEVYDTAHKRLVDSESITARIANKFSDFLGMGYYGTSCYRPGGGFSQSMLGMLNDAHEHIIVFEQNKKPIGRANLHGAWLDKELVLVLEKPYTARTHLAPQMVTVAEKLCKKIHKVTGIRTIKRIGQSAYEVIEPTTRFKKFIDYGGGRKTVHGSMIEHRPR